MGFSFAFCAYVVPVSTSPIPSIKGAGPLSGYSCELLLPSVLRSGIMLLVSNHRLRAEGPAKQQNTKQKRNVFVSQSIKLLGI